MKLLLTLTLLTILSASQLFAGSCPFKAEKEAELKCEKETVAVETECSKKADKQMEAVETSCSKATVKTTCPKALSKQCDAKMPKCEMCSMKKSEMKAEGKTDAQITEAMSQVKCKKCVNSETKLEKQAECAKGQACPKDKAQCSKSKTKCESKQCTMCVASDRCKQELKDSAESKSCPMTQEATSVL